MVDRFRVGIITGTHGLGGEVKVLPTTDDPQRFKDLKSVYLTGGRDEKKLTVSSVKFAGRFVIVGFAEYGSIEDVEKLRGTNIEIDRKDAVKLKEGQYFIPDIIGLNVIEIDGRVIGTVTDVMETGANKVYVTETPEGKEILLPAIPDCIKEINPEEGYMRIYLMPGLEDL